MTTHAAEAPRRLSLGEKARLVGEVAGSYRRARRLIRRHDLRFALAELRGGDAGGEPLARAQLLEGARLGRVVGRVLGLLPVESRCLVRSLVLTELLSRRAIPSTLVIGVKPGDSFGAHAWVELNGVPLLPSGAGQYARLVDL